MSNNGRGEKNHRAKLSDEAVREIRASAEKSFALALKYKVNDSYIRKIKRREARPW